METAKRGGGMRSTRACHCVLVSRVSGGGGIPGERSRVAGSGTPRPLVVAQCARAVTLEGMRERALFETVP
jgi:hypothetical protein